MLICPTENSKNSNETTSKGSGKALHNKEQQKLGRTRKFRVAPQNVKEAFCPHHPTS